MVLSDRAIALTRRPVKDKGALMQTLHLRFRDLRAISPGQSPSRWQTPSMRLASKWETASPLPNPQRPTCAVGWRPTMRHPDGIPCPVAGAGLPRVPRLRAGRIVGPVGADPYRVCPRQTACHLSPYPAHHKAGDLGADDRQARASEVQCTPLTGLSFPLRPQRSGTRACGEKTADLVAHVGAWAGVSSAARRQRLRHRSVVR